MAKLNIKLKSSTLDEVITAMVILMAVFGIGLFIFTNLFRSNSNLEMLETRKQLLATRYQYLTTIMQDDYIIVDSISYNITEEDLIAYPDLIKLKIFAEKISNQTIIDSLISIHPKKTITYNE